MRGGALTALEIVAKFERAGGCQARRNGDTYRVRCTAPGHEDRDASLDVTVKSDRVLLNCRSRGCHKTNRVGLLAAAGLDDRDLFLDHAMGRNGASGARTEMLGTPAAVFDYRDAEGRLLYQVRRYSPKTFRKCRPDGRGGWTWNLPADVPRVPYRLQELAEHSRVYHVEGEGCADRLGALGIPATTTEGGAEGFAGQAEAYVARIPAAAIGDVVVLPDNDAAGEKYAAAVATALQAAGVTVRVVELPGLPPKGDIVNWLDAGHAVEELRALADAAPLFEPVHAIQGDNGTPTSRCEARDAGWADPEPVPAELLPVPSFDAARLLPASLVPWVQDIADRAQCPPDFVGVGAMVAVAGIVGRRLAIRPKRHDDWTVVPNLWGLSVGRPGIMKSPAFGEALGPLHRLVAAREAQRAQMGDAEFRKAEAAAKRADLDRRLKKAVAAGEDTEALRREYEAAPAYVPPRERRYIVNDSTVEKLGELLNENREGLLLFRDEVAGLLRTMDREGHENDRAFYCEAWNGTGSYVYDRIGRGTIHIEAACISILGSIQPGPLHAYLREMFGAGFKDDGLVQRFQLMVYPDTSGPWRNVDRWPDADARQRAFDLFRALATLDSAELCAHDPATTGPAFLRFTPEAQALFDGWRADLEAKLRVESEHPVIVAHLAKYRSLMPSLALLCHVVDCVDAGRGGPVSADAAERAVAWCRYLEAHARRVYRSLTDNARLAAAVLAAKLTTGALPDPFVARDIRRKGWAGLKAPDEIVGALDLLEGLHWIAPEAVRPQDNGGRPTTRYHVNPAVRDMAR